VTTRVLSTATDKESALIIPLETDTSRNCWVFRTKDWF